MIHALLYHVQMRTLSRSRVEITLSPTRLGQVLRRRVRVGIAYRGTDQACETYWWWLKTDRYVGLYIERYIEAAPIVQIEDMSVEQLLLESPTPSPRSKKRP